MTGKMSEIDAIAEIREIIRREITRASAKIPTHCSRQQFRVRLGELFPLGDITTIWCEEAIAAEEDFFRQLPAVGKDAGIKCRGGQLSHIPEQKGPVPIRPTEHFHQQKLL